MKIYFAGSIRGGRSDAALYHDIIGHIKEKDTVLTEQVGDMSHSVKEGSFRDDGQIYYKDTAWLRECDMVIAECTAPSLGVGYELAYAERHSKPVHIFYRPAETSHHAIAKAIPISISIPIKQKKSLFLSSIRSENKLFSLIS